MPPAWALGRALSRTRGVPHPTKARPRPICLFCSLSTPRRLPLLSTTIPTTTPLLRTQRTPYSALTQTQHKHSREYSSSSTTTNLRSDPRVDLHNALRDLQTLAPAHVHLARLQLALRNLSEPPGHESIRVAVLGVPPSTGPTAAATATARRLLQLALADPLQPAAPWEARLVEGREFNDHDGEHAQALIVRVVGAAEQGGVVLDGTRTGAARATVEIGIETAKEHAIPELKVTAPALKGAEVEMLVGVLPTAAVAAGAGTGGASAVDDAVLVPTPGVAATTAGHVAPVETPVHMALLVGDGVRGAAEILGLSVVEGRDVILGAVQFDNVGEQDLEGCPVVAVNLDTAAEGLALFRANVGNAMRYEALWTEANISQISEWLKKGVLPNEDGDGTLKAPVRNLITSLLRSARTAVQEEETRILGAQPNTTTKGSSPTSVAHLDQALTDWAQGAHQELQQQLDAAFTTRPWSRLRWWKLFWRADDVGMVTSELVGLRFLPQAEKDLIYLAGRIQEASGGGPPPQYTAPSALDTPSTTSSTSTRSTSTCPPWPTTIPHTRTYLQTRTVPALQALAQTLVLQSATLAGLTSTLAALSYLSSVGAYECGAIAALGLVLSFRRFQRKWDAARMYWEGEVREEGRKAIRAAEGSVAGVLEGFVKGGGKGGSGGEVGGRVRELEEVRRVIERAEEALGRLK
ncbi:uncharacterized protein C8A04DRAFT_9222 [Dichotomopilus funicola]|uniref:Mmc1 C-terminal domain-containing protein n=1 Tax=Dichotomopilus funicola TaxID=1934379 RepID=A0AAN6V9I5_9PEZI|nr:hypothetical protein C8A04DRAFT_9222 [Dichotomopilus funicola]